MRRILAPLQLTLLALALTLFQVSCKKKDHVDTPETQDLVTPVGTPVGQTTTQAIGAAGGTVTSPDGKIKVDIPAGALSSSQQIGVQVLNYNEATLGLLGTTGYRLTPNGTQFSKPVTITISYASENISNTIPEWLGIAYQNENGAWVSLGEGRTVDKVNKTISIKTTHFTDWRTFEALSLNPKTAFIDQGKSMDLQLETSFEWEAYDKPNLEDLFVPIPKTLKTPKPLNKGIKSVTASMGSVNFSGGTIKFTAPTDKIGTAVVSCKLDNSQFVFPPEMSGAELFLVSNITVRGSSLVKYLEVDEDGDVQPDGSTNKIPVLYLYGAFGADPGASKRSVKIAGVEVPVKMWLPSVIACQIDQLQSGEVVISSQSNTADIRTTLQKWEGKFVYTRFHGGVANSNNADALKEQTTFSLVYRGFGTPCPADVTRFLTENQLNGLSVASYSISGKATIVQPDNCHTTTSVDLGAGGSGTEPLTRGTSANDYFTAQVEEVNGGINVTMDLNVTSAVTGFRRKYDYPNCSTSSSQSEPRTASAGFEGFKNTKIGLSFVGTTSLKLTTPDMKSTTKFAGNVMGDAWNNEINPPNTQYVLDAPTYATFKDKP